MKWYGSERLVVTGTFQPKRVIFVLVQPGGREVSCHRTISSKSGTPIKKQEMALTCLHTEHIVVAETYASILKKDTTSMLLITLHAAHRIQ